MELRDLVEAGAFLIGSVEVVVAGDLMLRAGFDEDVRERPRARLVADMERTVGAVQRIAAALVSFRLAEEGQDVAP